MILTKREHSTLKGQPPCQPNPKTRSVRAAHHPRCPPCSNTTKSKFIFTSANLVERKPITTRPLTKPKPNGFPFLLSRKRIKPCFVNSSASSGFTVGNPIPSSTNVMTRWLIPQFALIAAKSNFSLFHLFPNHSLFFGKKARLVRHTQKVSIMATPNRCCGQSPKRYHNAHTGKFWIECPVCKHLETSRSVSFMLDAWNARTTYAERIPSYLNSEFYLSVPQF